ncbi:MAG: hypothetical protein J0L92_23470 [Deltaproteobacteria bacterium]|nr:hypothetical protein [Deltaproteobacteria bacterium]
MTRAWTIRTEKGRELAATAQVVRSQLERLQPEWPPSFAILEIAGTEEYYQAAGGGGGMLLEKREGGRHFRAFQAEPVVPFEDGTQLRFGGNRIPLRRDEWFSREQVIECWTCFVASVDEPTWVRWRDITDLLSSGR